MARTVVRKLVALLLMAIPLVAAEPTIEELLEAGHYKRARAAAERRLKADPNDAEALYALGRIKLDTGDSEGALQFGQKVVALDASKAKYHYLLAGANGQMAEHAGVFKQLGLARSFRREAEQALALDPNYIEARFGLMEFYWQAPGIIGGDKKKAYAMAQEIQRLNPARGFLALAELATKEKEFTKAGELYFKAGEADPSNYNVLLSISGYSASDRQKKYDLAEKYAREGLKLDPGRAGAYSILAIVYALGERWSDLDALLAQAEKNVPDDWNPHYQAARILYNSGKDLPRAERYFRKYLTQEPEGNSPHWAAAYWRLGLVLEKQGHKPEAIAEIETALKLEPNFEPAKKDLRRLK